MRTYFVVPSEGLDWHKAPENRDSQYFVRTKFIVSSFLGIYEILIPHSYF